MLGFFFRLESRVALITLAVLGAAVVLLIYRSIGHAGIGQGDNVGHYTYPTGDCSVPDGLAADPINVVFYDGATKPDLDYYFDLYHGWGDNGGDTQWFNTHGQCHAMDGQPSSNLMGYSRYHARYHRGLKADGAVDIDSLLGDYTIAAAHYEVRASGGACGLAGHVVPEEGFNQGRNNVRDNWIEGGHWSPPLYLHDWANTALRLQCDGETVAQSDGDVAFIRVATDNVEGISNTSTPANLWVCYGPNCNAWNGEGTRLIIEHLRNQSGIGLGGYSFFTTYDSSQLDIWAANSGFLGSTGRAVSCSPAHYPDLYGFGCSSSGSQQGPLWDGDLATLFVSPDPLRFFWGNPEIRPTRNYCGIPYLLEHGYCTANQVDGTPLPGSNGSYTETCGDVELTVRVLEGDIDLDCDVDVVDKQAIAFRYGSFCGLSLYDPWYDLEGGDCDIDIIDLQFVFGRGYATCAKPIPAYQSDTCWWGRDGGGEIPEPERGGSPDAIATVRVDPETQNVNLVGQEFTVDAWVDGAVDLGAYEVKLEFDPSILQFVTVNNGSFLGSTGREVTCPAPIIEDDALRFGCNTEGAANPGPEGSGQLVQFTFQALAEGTSALTLTMVGLADPLGESLPADVQHGSVTVSLPEPGNFAVRPCGSDPNCGSAPQYLYFTWDPVPGVETYQVCSARSIDMQEAQYCYTAVAANSFTTFHPLQNGKLILYWAVRAEAGTQVSNFSKRGASVRFQENVGGYPYAEYWTIYKTGPDTKVVNGWNFLGSPMWMAFNNHYYAPGSAECQSVPPRGCEPVFAQAPANQLWFGTSQLWDPPDYPSGYGPLVAVLASPGGSFQPNDWSWISTWLMWW